jgi:hypothetical protein
MRKPMPAMTAAPPRPKSVTCCRPAVPPPPVDGALVGRRVAVCRGVTAGDADRDGDGVALNVVTAVCVAVAVRVAGTAGVAVGCLVLDGALAELVAPRAGVVPAPAPLPEADVAGAGLVEAGAVAVPLALPDEVAVGPALTEGEKIDGTDDVALVQAVSSAERTTVRVTQPAAVSVARLTFMRPPYISGGQRP